jgi:hypothetical protein
MPDIHRVTITVARPSEGDLGTVEIGSYVVEDDVVTLTSPSGEPLRRSTTVRRGEAPATWSRKLRPGEDVRHVARELLWAKYRAGKQGSDFNRPLPRSMWTGIA